MSGCCFSCPSEPPKLSMQEYLNLLREPYILERQKAYVDANILQISEEIKDRLLRASSLKKSGDEKNYALSSMMVSLGGSFLGDISKEEHLRVARTLTINGYESDPALVASSYLAQYVIDKAIEQSDMTGDTKKYLSKIKDAIACNLDAFVNRF